MLLGLCRRNELKRPTRTDDSVAGFIEVVQLIVEETVQTRIDAGRCVGHALGEIFQGDLAYDAGDYKDACRHYRQAYQLAVPRHD